jgi:hypothetical protein
MFNLIGVLLLYGLLFLAWDWLMASLGIAENSPMRVLIGIIIVITGFYFY